MTTAEPLTLFDVTPLVVDPVYERGETIAQRFDRYHSANPWIFEALERLALDLHSRGRRIGVKALVEVVRWQYARTTASEDAFRVNNSFTSRYARLLIERHPELADAIECRELRAA